LYEGGYYNNNGNGLPLPPPYSIMLPIKIIGRPNGRTKEFKFKTSDQLSLYRTPLALRHTC